MDGLPAIRFACITDPTKQHGFFCATTAESFDRLLAAYEREDDLTARPWECSDPRIIAETSAWVADIQREAGRPPMVMIGSVENRRWVNWNLVDAPMPPVPTL